MENQNPDQNQNQTPPVQPTVVVNPTSQGSGQHPIPGAVGVMILGIIAAASFLAYGIPGIICGLMAVIKAKKANAAYQLNPGMYKQGMLSMVKTGKICGMIGLIGGAVVFIFVLIGIVAIAAN